MSGPGIVPGPAGPGTPQPGQGPAGPDTAPPPGGSRPLFVRVVTFGRLEAVSLIHSCVYGVLLISAFALGNPQPTTFIFGMAHGCIWIAMSLVCIAAARYRVIPFWLAVTVAILGGLGPFFGSIGFLYESRRRGQFA